MNFPDYLRSTWTDPRFQELPLEVKALLYCAISQVDQAGWWAPHPRLINAEIPGIDLKAAREQLAPWVQVHPTGWWSLKGYVELQLNGKVFNFKSGFQKGLHRVLQVHIKRELSADPSDTIEGSDFTSTGGPSPSNSPKSEANPDGNSVPPRWHGSPKTQVQCPQAPKPIVESPTRESEGASETAEPEPCFDDVVNVFAQMDPLSVLNVRCEDRDAVHVQASRRGWRTVYKAAGAYFAHGPGASPSLGDFLQKLPRLVQLSCNHSEVQWTNLPVDKEWPNGVQYKRWRCKACGLSQPGERTEYMPSDHVHNYQLQEGSAIVLNDNGEMVSVLVSEQCVGANGCGHRQALREVAA